MKTEKMISIIYRGNFMVVLNINYIDGQLSENFFSMKLKQNTKESTTHFKTLYISMGKSISSLEIKKVIKFFSHLNLLSANFVFNSLKTSYRPTHSNDHMADSFYKNNTKCPLPSLTARVGFWDIFTAVSGHYHYLKWR